MDKGSHIHSDTNLDGSKKSVQTSNIVRSRMLEHCFGGQIAIEPCGRQGKVVNEPGKQSNVERLEVWLLTGKEAIEHVEGDGPIEYLPRVTNEQEKSGESSV